MTNKEIQNIAKQTIEYIKTKIYVGQSLEEIRNLCERKMLELGADSFWYYNIGAFIFSNKDTIISVSGRKYKTPDRKIRFNDIITIDLSPKCNHLWGDYARTIIVENGRVVNCIPDVQNYEWRNGLLFEEELHNELIKFATPDTTFEELYFHINNFIIDTGYINLDFNKNLGHSIAKHKIQRIYIEKGNKKKLKNVKCFTFEPHISTANSQFGYKKEDIYQFVDQKLKPL